MITLKQRSLLGLAAIIAIASTQACGSSDGSDGTPAAGAPAAGAPAGGAPAGGAPAGGAPAAGAPAAGAPAGGAPAAGSGAGGASAGSGTGGASAGSGTGGASAGSGGSSAGSAGKGGGGSAGAAGGGSTATFAQVTTIINGSCTTGSCHNAQSGQVNFKTPSPDLYTVLTTAIPTSVMHCKGTTMVVPSNAASSFLVTVVSPGMPSCKNGTANETIGRMPDNCTTATCLSAAQIKTITDWINAGATK